MMEVALIGMVISSLAYVSINTAGHCVRWNKNGLVTQCFYVLNTMYSYCCSLFCILCYALVMHRGSFGESLQKFT